MSPQIDRPLRILLVDDTETNRRVLGDMLADHPEFDLVATASNGEEALTEVFRVFPDVVCLDLQMPRMDGFTFLRLLMARHPMPVVVFSANSTASKTDIFKALELGALDCVLAPEGSEGLPSMEKELLDRLRLVRALRVEVPGPNSAGGAVIAPESVAVRPLGLVVIGASTGGPTALQHLLRALPSGLPIAVLVAQHMPERFTGPFADRLARMSRFDVSEARDGDVVTAGRVLVAPGGKHLKVERGGSDGRDLVAVVVEPEPGTLGKRYCPSIDMLFESAARAMGERACAIILTGMGADGRRGVEAVKAAGGMTLAESEKSALIYGMPREAADSGSVDEVLPLDKMADRIVRFARAARTAGK